ncbi:MAG: hypothetical protein Q7K44_00320 [Candidatus Liptonbacteria bacterium]|nr:hypothetical protein [Candidatus Liptonbacteria bacterium]
MQEEFPKEENQEEIQGQPFFKRLRESIPPNERCPRCAGNGKTQPRDYASFQICRDCGGSGRKK